MQLTSYLQFVGSPPDTSLLYAGIYDPWLVLLSILIASFAAYAALDVAARIASSPTRAQAAWWTGIGALAMGGGTWAMHFIGMLAFDLPCRVSYDPDITLISILPGILASAVALRVISRRSISRRALLVGGVLLGMGIGAMHYTGMAAYRLDGLVRYDPALFAFSLVVAVLLAFLALWIRFGLYGHVPPRWLALLSALVMGGAVSGMHYTAMAAAYFISDGRPDIADSGLSANFLAIWIGILTALLIGLVLVATMAWRQRDLANRLQISEQRIRRILDTTQEGFLMTDLDDVVAEVNPAFAKLLGGRPEDFVGHSIYDFVDAANRAILLDQGAMRERGEQSIYEVDLTRLDGALVPCQFSASPISDETGAKAGAFALVSDFSSRRAHEAYVRQVVAMFESTAEGVMLTDLKGRIVSVNPAFTSVTGYSETEALGQNPRFLQSGRHNEVFYQAMWAELNATGHWQGELWNRRKNGEVFPEWLTVSAVRDAGGAVQSYVGVFSDISHIKRSEAELERLAHYDPLTGLPNRILMHAQLNHALDRAGRHKERVAVMVLDLDGFKTVNDSLGHPAGDLLLQTIAGRLQQLLRREDTVARMGGDEFAVIVEAIGNPGLIAEKIIRAVAEPVELDGHSALVTASVGIALFPDDGNDTTSLLQAADMAMYASKQAGRNTSRFHHADMTRAAQQRLVIEQGLRRALDNDELEVWFQPQFALATGALVGAEALVRWRSPERGLVPPNDFIPIAEETGLILPLGEWVLRQSCRHAVAWQARGLEAGSVSVNVAGPQIERGDFFAIVQTVLEETGWPAERLELEITESFLLRNAEQAMAVVQKLSELGVKVAIDDFGTGYSSLSYLKYLRVNKLKIDQSFVRDLPGDHDDAAITRAVISLGHNLGFSVIAEGVESDAQREFLKQEGCDQAQGYFYSRPLPAAEFENFLRARIAAV
ncbi:MAG: EAL domain-containing protein [Pseudomonadota bacterium]|nr:EAL domain-containing protein [Pseudomonadota bacterium]